MDHETNVSLDDLTPRQRQILGWMAFGWSNKDIAKQMQISEKTVKTHNTTLFKVLRVKNRTSAVHWYHTHAQPA